MGTDFRRQSHSCLWENGNQSFSRRAGDFLGPIPLLHSTPPDQRRKGRPGVTGTTFCALWKPPLFLETNLCADELSAPCTLHAKSYLRQRFSKEPLTWHGSVTLYLLKMQILTCWGIFYHTVNPKFAFPLIKQN